MRNKGTFALGFASALGAAATAAWLLAFGGGVGCSTYTTLKNAPLDCTAAESGYTFNYLTQSTDTSDDPAGGSNWWGAGDYVPDGGATRAVDTVETMTDGERCGSKTADVLSTSDYNDWGSLFGFDNFGTKDASDWDGIAFWARAPGDTTKGFTLLLDDPNTYNSTTAPGYCVNYGSSNTPGQGNTPPPIGPDGTPISTSGSATFSPYPEACGNSYSVVMLVTGEWAFYAIPFSRFQQDPKPNRVPNERLTTVGKVPGTALLTDRLTNLIIRFTKEANTNLWIDNLAFYKKM
jgi:hypothetical protein